MPRIFIQIKEYDTIVQDLLFTDNISFDKLIPRAIDDINNTLEVIENKVLNPKAIVDASAPLLEYMVEGNISSTTAISVSKKILEPILLSVLNRYQFGDRVELIKQYVSGADDEVRDILIRTYPVKRCPRQIAISDANEAVSYLMVNFYESVYQLRRQRPWKNRK